MTSSALDLGYYEDVDLYEAPFEDRRADIDFFTRLAERARGPVLEYGAGAGRITLPLARAGHEVVAVDRSRAMLTRLNERLANEAESVQARVLPLRGDMRRLQVLEAVHGQDRFGRLRGFELVLATFNVVAHLPRLVDMQGWLHQVTSLLSPRGELVFDVPLPEPEELEADPDEPVRLPDLRHPVTGQWIEQDERYDYDPAEQTLTVQSAMKPRGARDATVSRLVLRQWFPQEIASFLRYEGFDVELTADYTDLPAAVAEQTLIVKARRRPTARPC